MFCPKCGQSQTSTEMRSCSRCGFQLGSVTLILNNDGALPATNHCPRFRSARSRAATESVLLTGFSWLIVLLFSRWLYVGGLYENIAVVGSVIFFFLGLIGLLRFLYAFLFMKSETTVPSPKMLDSARSQLSPPIANPISDWARREVTREMAPMSVTDNTTRLLD